MGARTFPGDPCDGHILGAVLEQAAVPLHHPSGTGLQTRVVQRCRAGDAEAEESVAQRHDPHGDMPDVWFSFSHCMLRVDFP